MEAAIEYLGEKQEDLAYRQRLLCDWAHRSISVPPMPWNQTIHYWEKIKKQMYGSLHDILTFDARQLKDQIGASLLVVENHTLPTEAWQSLSNNLQWLNPATWFSSTKWAFFGVATVIILFFFSSQYAKLE